MNIKMTITNAISVEGNQLGKEDKLAKILGIKYHEFKSEYDHLKDTTSIHFKYYDGKVFDGEGV